MQPRTTLKIIDGIRVVVPDSLNLITTYVLREQGDWFEDEIRFVRKLMRPGQNAIDIGANYGVFSLSMAKAVGSLGKIWAFEPASSTASYLAESIAINDYAQVTLDQRALSSKAGTCQLSLNDNSELNGLVREEHAGELSETVTLTTLDAALAQYGWKEIDFLKIDAEGEEAAIIDGGQRFFQSLSPLVQYEVKQGGGVDRELVRKFGDIGYSSYRLLPGLGVLVPFSPDDEIDGYLLNLYCCQADRAYTLAQEGLLVEMNDAVAQPIDVLVDGLLNRLNANSKYQWQNQLGKRPYAAQFAASWRETIGRGQSGEVVKALSLHAIAHDSTLLLPDRVTALRGSLAILSGICESHPDFLRYASLARVALEWGARAAAVSALDKLFQTVWANRQVNPAEPFLAPLESFETVVPGHAIGNWVMGATLEALERSGWYSSFYAGPEARERLLMIQKLGFGSPDMKRRLALVEHRYFGGPAPG